jgi:hypothetical protein
MFQTKVYRKSNVTYYVQSLFSYQKPYCLRDNVEKYGGVGQVTDDSIKVSRYDAIFIPYNYSKNTDTKNVNTY